MSDRLSQILGHINPKIAEFREQWNSTKAFPYFVADNFLPTDFAEEIWASYPGPDADGWQGKTYNHQRKKLMRTSGFSCAIEEFFCMTASDEFRNIITQITGVKSILSDPELVGGGLHQILQGGFLDVHVDFNFHAKHKWHRRLNLLVYMNKGWNPEYEGCLELWDMDSKIMIENVSPVFNRAVIFETNERSFHGHPRPLKCPESITRKSMAVYYYTMNRDGPTATEHNTIYKQTNGVGGYLKTCQSAIAAGAERFKEQGAGNISKRLIKRGLRKIKGLPPENG